MMPPATAQLEATFREEHGRILAALAGQLGDFSLAEDASGRSGHSRDGRIASRRAPQADVHLLPPGAGAGSAGCADPAYPRRAVDAGGRPGVPGVRIHDGPAPGARGKIREAGIPYRAPPPELLRRTGQREAAADAYGRAITLCGNRAERAYLQRRRDEMLKKVW
jgi:hypothetical protein